MAKKKNWVKRREEKKEEAPADPPAKRGNPLHDHPRSGK